MSNLISYAHQQEPNGDRFLQLESDPLPPWAVDVRPEPGTATVIPRK